MYRVIHQAFQDTTCLKYPEYDVFREEKCKGKVVNCFLEVCGDYDSAIVELVQIVCGVFQK